MPTRPAFRVPAGKRLAYAAPAFALAAVGIPIYVYLPKFYTDAVGVPVSVLGVLILGARVFDAVLDPLMGVVSDRTRTRFGRRRIYIAGASVPLALSLLFLFAPPETDPRTAAIWFGFWVFALFLFWTAVTVPYESLGPELTPDYDERTSLLGLRDGLLVAGTLAAAASPAIVTALVDLPPGPAGERLKFGIIAAVYAPLIVLLCAWCAAALGERAPARATSPAVVIPGLGGLLRNRPFVVLLASYTVSALGSNLPGALILYYVKYVLGSERADLFLVLYFLTGILCLPGWIALSGRVGKKSAWISAMAVNTGAFIGVFFLGPGDEAAYAALVVLSGTGFAATLALPSAMQADVIDYDELLSGERREGRYIGVWSIARKFAAAVGVGLALSLLGAAGYVPNAPQTPEVQLTLRVLYALVPCLCNLIAMGLALAYPIDRGRHRAILDAIAQRRDGAEVADPLRPGTILKGASGG